VNPEDWKLRWLLPVAVGLIVRLVVSAASIGSNDAVLWDRFATSILNVGLLETYVRDNWFNHPPLVGWGIAALKWCSLQLGIRFSILLKLPAIFADVALAAFVIRKVGPSLIGAWLVALSPLAISISAYHGNTDCLCALATLLAVHSVASGRPSAAGAWLGAAINVKLIPVIFIPLCLLAWRDRRDLWRFFWPLALWGVPFLYPFIGATQAFYQNAIAYKLLMPAWGINFFSLATAAQNPPVSRFIVESVLPLGKPLILFLSVGAALGHRFRTKPETTSAPYIIGFRVELLAVAPEERLVEH
jgi:Gpi18-like mannosyltransferase